MKSNEWKPGFYYPETKESEVSKSIFVFRMFQCVEKSIHSGDSKEILSGDAIAINRDK